MSEVRVEITDKSAIYVDDTRITDRSTKWGLHNIMDTFTCERSKVREECLKRGHRAAVRRIDDPVYLDKEEVA